MHPSIRPLELPESDIKAPHWSIVWSDLMMTMFILFVVLFVFAAKYKNIPKYFTPDEMRAAAEHKLSEKNIVIGHSLDQPAVVDLQQVHEGLAQRLGVFEPDVDVRHDPDSGILVTLHGRVIFPTGSAEPTSLALRVFDEIGASLIATRSFVTITAFADRKAVESSKYDSPWELAGLRAAKTAAHFTDKMNLEPERFAAQGFALTPLVPVDTALDRERNERVEIWLTGRYR